MTIIGLAYNQKPEHTDSPSASVRGHDGEGSRTDKISLPTRDAFAEWDNPETISAVEAALAPLGKVVRLKADESFPEHLRSVRPDIVFNIAEGLNGPNRESHVPAICEFFGVPYSGSDPFTLSLCLDKARTKETLSFHKLPNAGFTVVRSSGELSKIRELSLPLFVKPLHEGSSMGITDRNLCWDYARAAEQTEELMRTYRQPVLVEQYLPGKEFTCGVLGNGMEARVLPIVGMNFDTLPEGALPIYSYDAKYIWDKPDNPLDIFECPPLIAPSLRSAIESTVLAAFNVLGCRDWARIDVRLDADGVPNVIEVNPLPGILPDPAENSCLPKAARAAGLSYDELIQSCLRFAAARQGVDLTARNRFSSTAMSAQPAMAAAALA